MKSPSVAFFAGSCTRVSNCTNEGTKIPGAPMMVSYLQYDALRYDYDDDNDDNDGDDDDDDDGDDDE